MNTNIRFIKMAINYSFTFKFLLIVNMNSYTENRERSFTEGVEE
jgi:hypothetical protein